MAERDLRLFSHMIYEYKKGVRRLAMYTCRIGDCETCLYKLKKNGINYLITAYGSRVNIFFGDCPCINIIESFGKSQLNDFDEKEDFILGILLGYDVTKQCERYLYRDCDRRCEKCLSAAE